MSVVRKAVTAQEMRAIERAWFDSGRITLEELMERVGKSVADWISSHREREVPISQANVVALVGKGNNGGDALVASKHLARYGTKCVACICLPRDKDDPVRQDAARAGVRVLELTADSSLDELADLCANADVVIDGVFGFSISRAISEPLIGIFETVRRNSSHIVAIDMPSGADPDSGNVDPHTLHADVTLSIGMYKLGSALGFGHPCYGDKIEVLDYSLPPELNAHITREVIDDDFAKSLLPHRPMTGHKGSFGRSLLIAGSKNYIGAAVLATRACLKSGAGLVSLASIQNICNTSAIAAPEASYIPLPETTNGELDANNAYNELAEKIPLFESVLIGPGLGQSDGAKLLMNRLMNNDDLWHSRKVVLDADGLNIMSEVDGWHEKFGENLIITPHPGEMSRLLKCSIEDIESDRLAVIEDAARRFGCVVILKGAVTLIAHPNGQVRISMMANSGMGRGGTGDVLAGLVTGIANSLSAFDAATLGVYLHGVSGMSVERYKSVYGMTASDVADNIPWAWYQLAS